MTHAVSICGLRLSIGGSRLLHGFGLHVSNGERVGLTGVSGVGKTTLLRSIAMNSLPEGSYAQEFSLSDKGTTYVPQSNGLLDWYTVRSNFFALTHGRVSGDSTEMRKIEEIAGDFRIAAQLDDHPTTLSGGQYQRAVLAIGAFARRRLVLIDEPLTAVDIPTKLASLDTMDRRFSRGTSSMLIVSHDLDILLALTDRVVVIKPGSTPSQEVDLSDRATTQQASTFLTTSENAFRERKRLKIFNILTT